MAYVRIFKANRWAWLTVPRVIAFSLASSIALVVFVTYLAPRQSSEIVGTEVSVAQPAVQTPTPAGPVLEAKNDTPTASQRSLLDDFISDASGRGTILRLWARAGEGGQFYASKMVDTCAMATRFTPVMTQGQADLSGVDSANQLLTIAAHGRIQRMCDQLTQDELDKYSRMRLIKDTTGPDPLMKAVRTFSAESQNKSSEAYAKSLRTILDMRDPLVLDDLGMRLSLYPGPQGAYLYFDGTRYPVREDPPILAAYALVPCELGLNCAEKDLELTLACASGGTCYRDRYEKTLHEAAGSDMAKLSAIRVMAKQIAEAIRNGDAAKFLPQH